MPYRVENRLDGRGFDVVDSKGIVDNDEPFEDYDEALSVARWLSGEEEEAVYWTTKNRSEDPTGIDDDRI